MNSTHLKLLKKAQTLDLAGKTVEASAAYRAFLDREPRHANAWADYAGKLVQLDKLDEALKAVNTALQIEPHHLSARINLGCILFRRDQLDASEIQFRKVLTVDPHRLDALLFLTECLLNKRDLDGAQKVLEGATQLGSEYGKYSGLKARHAELWTVFALALFEIQRFEEAEAACATALQIDPCNFMAKAHIGSIRMANGQLDDAEALLRQLVAEYPSQTNARLLLITCLSRKGDQGAADQKIAEVLQQAPNDFVVHRSLSGTYYSHGRWAEYKAEIQRYLQADPTSAYVEFEQSFADLIFGDMTRGWERYEARLRIPKQWRPNRSFPNPAWKGESFAGKTLLLWAEQGFGDTLMYIRYLPLVKALGGRIILETQPALLAVAATCQGADLVIPRGDAPPPFDLQCSLMSLPWMFRTELSSVPSEIPYLDVPGVVPHKQAIQELLAMAKDHTRIGLVWAGSPGHARDVERSLPSAALAPLGVLPGVVWFSFQLGRREIPPLPNLISLAPLLSTFSDTAYALSGMDLVITVDTAVAHLAGALGIPTLLLLAFQPDYRWMLDRDDSPWYPSLHLYRQPTFGDWESVIRQVVKDLAPES